MLTGTDSINYRIFSKFEKFQLPVIISIPFIFFLLVYVTNSVSTTSIQFIGRVIFGTFGPILSFLFFLLLGLRYFGRGELKKYQDVLGYALLLSILGIYFALMMNNRSFIVISSLVGVDLIDQRSAALIVFAVIAPLIEEFVKIFPAIVLARHLNSKDNSTFVKNPTIFLLVGLMGGAVFNLLETYWYIWGAGGSTQIYSNEEIWYVIQIQIIIRSLNPLHIATAMISALGVLQAINLTTQRTLSLNNLGTFFPYFAGSVVLHGLWNGYLTIAENPRTYLELPLFNWFLGMICLGIVIYLIYFYRNLSFPVCQECNSWHVLGLSHENEMKILPLSSQSQSKVNMYSCSNCQVNYNALSCPTCDTIEVFSCDNCSYPLPIYARSCWKCNVNITPLYDNITELPPTWTERLILNFFYLSAFMNIIQILLLLVTLVNSGNFGQLGTQILLFMIISFTLGIAIYLSRSDSYRQWGFIVAQYIVGLLLISVSLIFVFFIVLVIELELVLSLLLLILGMVFFGFMGFKVLIPSIIFVRSNYV